MKNKVKNKNTPFKNILSKIKLQIPKIGDIIEGEIIEISKEGLFVGLGNFKTGVIPMKELKENAELLKSAKAKKSIPVKIIELDNEDGFVEISMQEAGSEKNWANLQDKMKAKETIKSKVLKANKGGIILEVDGIPAFMPVSQLSQDNYPRVEGNTQKILQALQKLVGQELNVRILTIEPNEEKLIVSEKIVNEKKLQESMKKYKIGDIVEGSITGVVDFGVFVKFNDLEGLVHISELAYQLIKDPRDIFKIGEKVKVKIIEIDKEQDKISLSIKALKKNPWEKVEEKYKTGQIVKGIITSFNPFGTFIQLDKNIHGLAHISEFNTEEKMKEALEIGKKYDFEILSIKPKEYRMALKPIFKKEVKEIKKTKTIKKKTTTKANK